MAAVSTMLLAASVGLSAVSAVQQLDAAEDLAQQQAEAGEAEATAAAKATAQLAASQRVSFLKSGVAFSGTPQDVVTDTFDIGKDDVAQIISNTQSSVDSTISTARSSFLTSIGTTAMSAFGSGLFGGTENMAGQSIATDPTISSPMRKPI